MTVEASCEIEEVEGAGRLMIAKVRDLVKIGPCIEG